MMASFFTWILLAGFVILPGTFNSLEQIQAGNSVENLALHAVQNIPLCVIFFLYEAVERCSLMSILMLEISRFVIAYVCCATGAIGMIWLWWRWSANYVWLLQRRVLRASIKPSLHAEHSCSNRVGSFCAYVSLWYRSKLD